MARHGATGEVDTSTTLDLSSSSSATARNGNGAGGPGASPTVLAGLGASADGAERASPDADPLRLSCGHLLANPPFYLLPGGGALPGTRPDAHPPTDRAPRNSPPRAAG